MSEDEQTITHTHDYYINRTNNIHPASRGVAAHTAGLFRSVRGAKGPVEASQAREFSLFPPRVGFPSEGIFPRGGFPS